MSKGQYLKRGARLGLVKEGGLHRREVAELHRHLVVAGELGARVRDRLLGDAWRKIGGIFGANTRSTFVDENIRLAWRALSKNETETNIDAPCFEATLASMRSERSVNMSSSSSADSAPSICSAGSDWSARAISAS